MFSCAEHTMASEPCLSQVWDSSGSLQAALAIGPKEGQATWNLLKEVNPHVTTRLMALVQQLDLTGFVGSMSLALFRLVWRMCCLVFCCQGITARSSLYPTNLWRMDSSTSPLTELEVRFRRGMASYRTLIAVLT